MYSRKKTELDWFKLLNGECPKTVFVGSMTSVCAVKMGCMVTSVYVDRSYIKKLRHKHRIQEIDTMALPHIISEGEYFEYRGKGGFAIFWESKEGRPYFAAVKVANGGREVWLKTFFKITHSEMRRRKRKGRRIN